MLGNQSTVVRLECKPKRGVKVPRFRNILCPIDLDEKSITALSLASQLGREHNATLYLFHVLPGPPGLDVELPLERRAAESRTRLERISHQRVKPGTRYELLVEIGDPAVEILQLAARLDIDLIVMATHGRKGLRRLVLGSVTERVVREARCPVLTVKPARV